jgi:hypothetical protein
MSAGHERHTASRSLLRSACEHSAATRLVDALTRPVFDVLQSTPIRREFLGGKFGDGPIDWADLRPAEGQGREVSYRDGLTGRWVTRAFQPEARAPEDTG